MHKNRNYKESRIETLSRPEEQLKPLNPSSYASHQEVQTQEKNGSSGNSTKVSKKNQNRSI